MGRELDFFTTPRAVLVEEAMREWREMISENVPYLKGLPEGADHSLLSQQLQGDHEARVAAEALLNSRYRFPEDISENLIVSPEERLPVDEAISQAADFARNQTEGVVVEGRWGEGPVKPNFINLIQSSPRVHEARWHRIVLASFLRPDPQVLPFNAVLGFRAFLDAEEHLDDYARRGGCDEFWLNRDGDGVIQSYRVSYKGDMHPTTPWSHLHRDDLPIIHAFTQRIFQDISAVGNDVQVIVGNE